MTVTEFIKRYIDIINDGEFRLLYQKTEITLPADDVCKLTEILYKADIDPLANDCIIFGHFLFGANRATFNIPDNIKEIWDSAFENSAVDHIYIPPTLNYIGNYAFNNTYLNKLVIEDRTSDLYIASNAFTDCEIDYIEFKGSTENWKRFVEIENAFDDHVMVMCKGGNIIHPSTNF